MPIEFHIIFNRIFMLLLQDKVVLSSLELENKEKMFCLRKIVSKIDIY